MYLVVSASMYVYFFDQLARMYNLMQAVCVKIFTLFRNWPKVSYMALDFNILYINCPIMLNRCLMNIFSIAIVIGF